MEIKNYNIIFYKLMDMASRYNITKDNKKLYIADITFPLYFKNEQMLNDFFGNFSKKESDEGIFYIFQYFDVFLSKEVYENSEKVKIDAIPLYIIPESFTKLLQNNVDFDELNITIAINYLLMPRKVQGIFRIDGYDTLSFLIKFNKRDIPLTNKSFFLLSKHNLNKDFFIHFFLVYHYYNYVLCRGRI